ncbi:MAG: hypothetical protein HN348_26495 [Proteobacteria bacterium]|nr:hypothetical protein [Pseudomonadota bacterium]
MILMVSLGLVGCNPMGSLCKSSGECGEGICLKGVCSGYSCDSDEDCVDDYECAVIEEVQTCALPCDDECPGEQQCLNGYCL